MIEVILNKNSRWLKNYNRLSIFRPIQTVLIFCALAPIAKLADFEVTYACPKIYPDKLTMCNDRQKKYVFFGRKHEGEKKIKTVFFKISFLFMKRNTFFVQIWIIPMSYVSEIDYI